MIKQEKEEKFLRNNMEQLNSKILLFGEYAILHDGMALVIPFDKYHGRFEKSSKTCEINTEALQSNEYLRKFCAFISSRMNDEFVLEVKKFEKELDEGLFFKSNIPQGYGLGSSGALVAAIVLRYLVKAKNIKDDIKLKSYQKIKELKSSLGDLESYFHGVSSGLDPLSIILNEPILYQSTQNVITAELPKQSADKSNVIFLVDSESPRTTSNMMKRFNNLIDTDIFKNKFENYIQEDNNGSIQSFLNNDMDKFYKNIHNLSMFQYDYMKEFFPEKLQSLVAKGLDNGDYSLKLCGAGGGGFTLGFTRNWETTKNHLKDYQLEEIYAY